MVQNYPQFTVVEGVSDRLREARLRVGLKQVEIAEYAGIARATQVSYETGVTEPTTKYLRDIQASGVDIPFILFGQDKAELDTSFRAGQNVNWTVLRQAHDCVEFFCLRFAPMCPDRYRWEMVAQIYPKLLERTSTGTSPVPEHEANVMISNVWAAMVGNELSSPARRGRARVQD